MNFTHLAFGWANAEQMLYMQQQTFKVNKILSALFRDAAMILVDFKLEFGVVCGGAGAATIVLGDEFTPDGCRIWDAKTKEKLDKDRFRKGMGDVIESYKIAANRLGIVLDG